MYEHLRGRLVSRTPASLVVEAAGVGWFVETSTRTSAKFRLGDDVLVLVHHRQTEDAQRLFGFADADERDLFRRLLRISGIGPSHALNLLSAFEPADFWGIVRDGAEKRLSTSKGIGPKIAQRVLTELRDEAGRRSFRAPAEKTGVDTALPAFGIESDAVAALSVLGYGEPAAVKAVVAAMKKLGSDASVDAVVREALKSS
ncbi:MAG: Holliday junction branch migration protein RuvA [Planctomycetota bacterium]